MVRKGAPIVLVLALLLAAPSAAFASTPTGAVVGASILGSIFGSIGHAILGAFSWTVGLASKFLLTTLAGFVKLLIPQSWINQGLSVMEWIVAVPDYAGTVSTPGGGHEFGFAGINSLRELFMWLGLAVAPLTLTYATSRAMVEESEPIAAPLVRVVGLSVIVASYGYWWRQAAALADQVTHAILTLPDVSQGLEKLMAYAVGGVALGGWQLIDLGLMAAIGFELLGLIFLKVVLILCGALLYATGPLMIGLAATRGGHALARAWGSAVTLMFGIGIVWAGLFAVGALLINDAGTAGPLIAGDSAFGSLMGGLMLALAGLASLWMCLKVSREAGGLLRLQLAGAFSFGGSSRSAGTRGVESTVRTTGRSLSRYGARLATATAAAGGELAGAVPGGTALAGAGRSARQVGRRGLAGTAATAARAGARGVAPRAEMLAGHSRVGAVAVRAARAGVAGWDAPINHASARGSDGRSGTRSTKPGAGRPARGKGQNGANSASRRSETQAAKPGRSSTSRGAVSRTGAAAAGRSRPGRTTPTTSRVPDRSADVSATTPTRQGRESLRPRSERPVDQSRPTRPRQAKPGTESRRTPDLWAAASKPAAPRRVSRKQRPAPGSPRPRKGER